MKTISMLSRVTFMARASLSQRKAFTLIELLAVISIIVLLLAMLMPALSKARQQSLSVKCASNLKQLGVAVSLYAYDNNDVYPGPSWQNPFAVGTADPLVRLVQPYVGKQSNQAANQGTNIWICPAYVPGCSTYYDNTRIGYEVAAVKASVASVHNACVFGNIKDTPQTPPMKTSQVENYVGLRNDGTTTTRTAYDTWLMHDGAPADYGQAQWHNGGLNVLWADNHVSWNRSGRYVTGRYPDWWR